jgi:hypothetical protein
MKVLRMHRHLTSNQHYTTFDCLDLIQLTANGKIVIGTLFVTSMEVEIVVRWVVENVHNVLDTRLVSHGWYGHGDTSKESPGATLVLEKFTTNGPFTPGCAL